MAKKTRLTAADVQRLIDAAGGSGRELARRANVSPGSMSKWRNEGVSYEYGSKLIKAASSARYGKASVPKEVNDYIKGLKRTIRHQEKQIRASKQMSSKQIIKQYQKAGYAPSFDEAVDIADEYDIDIDEVYDAFYEEDAG